LIDRDKIRRENFSNYSKIAYRWAPIHYQHVNLDYRRRDMLCAVDYDGDWDTSNNRNNITRYPLIPVVYYGIAETGTHYYILYSYYHADDLTHENDLEGFLLVVEKKEDRVIAMICLAHFDFRSYIVGNRIKRGDENVDGKLFLEKYNGEERPVTKQDPNKHGCYAWKGSPWWMFWEPNDSKDCIGIRYVPDDEAFMPVESKISSFRITDYGYVLIDIAGPAGFWNRQHDYPNSTFRDYGAFNSSTLSTAQAPWGWKDYNDGLERGVMFLDPAKLTSRYFRGFKEFDFKYKKVMQKSE
jgi:hypothetical protein